MNLGDEAPDFTLKDGDGNDWTLSDQKGKTVVLLVAGGLGTAGATVLLVDQGLRDNGYLMSGEQNLSSPGYALTTDTATTVPGALPIPGGRRSPATSFEAPI